MIDRGFVKVGAHGAVREILTHPDFFGESALISDEPCRSSVHSLTLSQFMLLARDAFVEFLHSDSVARQTLVYHRAAATAAMF